MNEIKCLDRAKGYCKMKVGYARVSTAEQNLGLQEQALKEAGCERILREKGVSGSQRDRPQLHEALETLQEGDILVVWKLDRLGRSLPHLIEIVAHLGERRIGFQSLSEAIDTTSAGGKLIFHVMGALAEFERSLIVERTKAGMAAAKARGTHLGRKRKLSHNQLKHAQALVSEGRSRAEVARLLNVNPSTLYRRLLEFDV
jgi:DNA invertase Pin-like site-specific DNA recombinase